MTRTTTDDRGTHYLRMADHHHADLQAWAAVPPRAGATWLADYLNRHDVPIPEKDL